MKKLIFLILAASLTLLCCSCSGSKEQQSSQPPQSADTSAAVSDTASTAESSAEKITTSPSSAEAPLKLEKWGSAAKYCTAEKGYSEVPVRILSVRRGESVGREVKRLAEKTIFAYYSEPEEYEEYAIAEYEICLDGFPVDKGGTDIEVTAFIQGTDGEMMKLDNGSYWSATAMSLNNDSSFFYEGTQKGLLAYRIPKGRSDYLIVVGEAGEQQAYFSGV